MPKIDNKTILAEEERRFTAYLEEISSFSSSQSERSFCCNTSRSFYCPECYKVLVPQNKWPAGYKEIDGMDLPFQLDIILGRKERRNSSSGIQMMAICNMMQQLSVNGVDAATDKSSCLYESQASKSRLWWENTRLYDINRGETVPSYPTESTFVLFPSKNSVPISSVANSIERLIILDVKWSRSGIVQLDPSLSTLTAVHLEFPPAKSQFWRWHDGGDGMLSTMEAIYFASVELSLALEWPKKKSDSIINIMWLFALQRQAIVQRKNEEGDKRKSTPLPFSAEGKRQQQELRIRKDGRDIAARERRNRQLGFYDEIDGRK